MRRYLIFFLLCISTPFLFSFSLNAEEKNDVIVCEHSLDMLAWDLDFLREAKQSIEWAPCFFWGEDSARLFDNY